jgi:hypothetical protein
MKIIATVVIYCLIATSAFAADSEIAATFSNAAVHVFSTDFIQDKPEETFTAQELATLRNNRESLVAMIDSALGQGESVAGAYLIGYFRLFECAERLRYRFLIPAVPYGWEGTGPGEEAMLGDNQYVYHTRYYAALLALYGTDLLVNLRLTEQEKADIILQSERTVGEERFWAIWIRRKLGI